MKLQPSTRRTLSTALCLTQGAYYLLGGIWPLVSRRSFEQVLGRKRDFWLSQTSALQIALAGALLLRAARSGRISRDLSLLAGGTAAILAIMDVYCQNRPGTTRVYLLDVLAEAAFIAGWSWAAQAPNSESEPDQPNELAWSEGRRALAATSAR
jgi:hypothetical protein